MRTFARMPTLLKRIIHYTYRPWAIRYIKKDRVYRYKGLELSVPVGVFHPGLFFSTKILAELVESLPLKGKKLLELGSGSGLVSCVASRCGAQVLALDINPLAVRVTQQNAVTNGLQLESFESNLFGSIPAQVFDVIIVNPPYYPKDPKNHAESAWFAGAEFQYFHALFAQIGAYIQGDSKVFFSASEDVDLEKISVIALDHGFLLDDKLKKWTIWEWNYVYQLRISN
ncbi:MAG TPA: methyltransferase [Flavobacteriales bacterium]|nr:methyltransferase [Flavobacteriales bacterium]